jgi:hypothetical protein
MARRWYLHADLGTSVWLHKDCNIVVWSGSEVHCLRHTFIFDRQQLPKRTKIS